MKEPVYEVFARKTKEEPLHHIGFVNAPADDLAGVYAFKKYDEQNWCELCVIPRTAIVQVHRSTDAPAKPRPGRSAAVEKPEDSTVNAPAVGSYGGSDLVVGGPAR